VARLHVLSVSAWVIFVSLLPACSFAQDQPVGPTVFLPNQEVRVTNLPALTASKRSEALATELEIVLHDKEVCCGRDSALEDVALYATLSAVSLKELSTKLQGRHLLSDGRSFMVNAEYVPATSINAGGIVVGLKDQHAQLFEWKSRIYVLYGAIFDEDLDADTGAAYAIHKLLLLDPRYSDERRQVEFNRDTDDFGKVQGLLTLSVVRP